MTPLPVRCTRLHSTQMFATIIAAVTTLLTFAGLGYYLVAIWSARAYLSRERFPAGFAPGVSILKPLRGVDPGMAEAFAGHCRQQYAGEYEILFGVSSLQDPASAVVEQLQAEYPQCAIRLLVCPEVFGPNGKVSNVAQLAPRARYDYLVINDSDIHVSPRYLTRIMAPFAPASTPGKAQRPTGLVTALYRGRTHGTIGSKRGMAGSKQGTLGSKLEALGISTDFAVAVLTARHLDRRLRFGLGSTLAISRAALDAVFPAPAGLAPLAEYLADDYQLGHRVDAAGFRVELSEEVVETSVPAWSLRGFAEHQLRWLRTMRVSRPAGYAGMLFSFGLAWSVLNLIATGLSLPALALFSFALLFRTALALGVGVGILDDRQVLRDFWLLIPRDLIALALWAWSYSSSIVVWRDERFTIRRGRLVRLEQQPPRTPAAAVAEKNS